MAEDSRRELAGFLRARRMRVRPQDLGLEPGPRRRVAGLRREEVALLALFLHPQADHTCPDRKATVAELTAMLRAQVAADPAHPRAAELISTLTARSPEFAGLWARHDVGDAARGRMRIQHPVAGELNLDWDAYPVPGAPGPLLLVCTAPEGSADTERLQELAQLTTAAAG
jgi:hypothetical protein